MILKALKSNEVELGFICIPIAERASLIGQNQTPFITKLNWLPARIDRYVRIWSKFLKNKYPVNAVVKV